MGAELQSLSVDFGLDGPSADAGKSKGSKEGVAFCRQSALERVARRPIQKTTGDQSAIFVFVDALGAPLRMEEFLALQSKIGRAHV